MRLFVALVCVSFVAVASAQWPSSVRGRSVRSGGKLKLAVEPPTLLVKNAGIVPAVQLSDVAAETPEVASVSNAKRRIPNYYGYWPDYGYPTNGWYPGGWNPGYSGPGYWNTNWMDYGLPYYPRRRLVKPVTTSTTTTTAEGVVPAVDATLSAAVVPEDLPVPEVVPVSDVVPEVSILPDLVAEPAQEQLFTTQIV
ncbi:hypothetical protein KR018_006451 [Drosophila ironensis]|nr:hypothetical protein KR018_006451 [Drosophila ironensis]